jgi:hypothetical protein
LPSSNSGCKLKVFTDIPTVPRKLKLALLTVLWTGAVAFGLNVLMAYKAQPGLSAVSPATWPKNDWLNLSSDKPLLVMFAHPRCPCTHASITELALLAAQANGCFDRAVVFYEPICDSAAWTNSSLVHDAQNIPGLRVIHDTKGLLAKLFGAETSGHTLVYNANGKLVFSGGITGSRGHAGDNVAFDSVLQILRNSSLTTHLATAQVFGCSLFEECNQHPTK